MILILIETQVCCQIWTTECFRLEITDTQDKRLIEYYKNYCYKLVYHERKLTVRCVILYVRCK